MLFFFCASTGKRWKADLELEQFRNALGIQENDLGGGKV